MGSELISGQSHSSDSKAPLQCPLSGIPVMMKDCSREVRRAQERIRSKNYRLRLNRAMSMKKRKPQKKKKGADELPGKWQTLPAMLPYSLLKSMVRGGLIHHLSPDLSITDFSFTLCFYLYTLCRCIWLKHILNHNDGMT